MTWKIELEDIKGDKCLLRAALEKNSYLISKEGKNWLLEHPKYLNYQSANDIYENAKLFVENLCEMANLEDAQIDARVGSVQRHNGDGSINRHIFASAAVAISLSAQVSAVAVINSNLTEEEREEKRKEAERIEAERKRATLIARVSKAPFDRTIIDVTKLMKNENITLTDAGHIIDLVQHAMHGNMSKFATKAELSRFSSSINNPEVMGLDARHAVAKHDKPKKPMNKDEAIQFAKGIGKKWLEIVVDDT